MGVWRVMNLTPRRHVTVCGKTFDCHCLVGKSESKHDVYSHQSMQVRGQLGFLGLGTKCFYLLNHLKSLRFLKVFQVVL